MQEELNKKDELVMKIIHYFITEQDYKPIIVTGINNEIWLENFDNNIKLIRININYIHNDYQYKYDLKKASSIMKSIKKKTYSLNMNMLNILVDFGDNVTQKESVKNIESIKVKKITDLKKNKFIQDYFPTAKEKILTKKSNVEDMIKMTTEMNEKSRKEEKKLAKIFKPSKPYMTYIFIAINIMIFLLTAINSLYYPIVNTLLNHYSVVKAGELWRLITAAFLHIDIIHLLFNMYALKEVGKEVERYYGSAKFFIIFIISAIVGNLLSCVLNTNASLGASGAIYGLFGSLIYFGLCYRATLDKFLRGSLIPVLAINLLISLSLPNIDIFGHIGGLVGGFFASMIVGIKDKGKENDRTRGIIMLIIFTAFLWYLLIQK